MLIIGIAGHALTEEERGWIAHPYVGGVILFKRNFADRGQVTALIESIRRARAAPLLLCVDQEGGPVQRFRDGFTVLPALAKIGALYERDRSAAVARAEEHAWVMASEMRAVGIDLSFAPVVDVQRGNVCIGERAFHPDPEAVSELSLAYLRGMRVAGMAATIKHFPGHGSVREDTHVADAVDPRTLDEIGEVDLKPFADAIEHGAEAVMMAHVRYPGVDERPAGYSPKWIGEILRRELGFRGAVFSDDIGMAAAFGVGGVPARIAAHLDAGCDFVLVCHPELVPGALAAVLGRAPEAQALVERLQGLVGTPFESLADNPQRTQFIERLAALA